MVIGKFNRYFARHGRLTFGAILVVLGVSMTFYFGPSIGGHGRGVDPNADIGSLGDRPLQLSAIEHRMQGMYLLNQYLRQPSDAQMGDPLKVHDESLLRRFAGQLIFQMRVLREAEAINIDHVSPTEIADYIKSLEGFQTDNRFDPAKFQAFKTKYLQVVSMSAQDFDKVVHDQIVLDRMLPRLQGGLTLPPLGLKLDMESQAMDAEVQYANFLAADFAADIQVSDADVKAEYTVAAALPAGKANRYTIPEQRQAAVAVIPIKVTNNDVQVTDAEIAAYYEANKATNFTKAQVHARMIYLAVPAGASDAEKAVLQKKMEGLAALITGGADFAALAKANSDDMATRETGGDLGWFTQYEKPFANLLFSMKDGEVSKVLTQPDGYRVYQRIAERDGAQPLESVSATIRGTLQTIKEEAAIEQQARTYYDTHRETPEYKVPSAHLRFIVLNVPQDADKAKIAALTTKLDGIRREALVADDFAAMARKYSDDPQAKTKGGDLGWWTNDANTPDFVKVVFTLKDGDISQVVDTPGSLYLFQRVSGADYMPYEGVADRLLGRFRSERETAARTAAEKVARAVADELANAVRSAPATERKPTLEARIKALGDAAVLRSTGMVSRGSDTVTKLIPNAPASLVDAVFAASVDVAPVSDVVKGTDAYYVSLLTFVKPAYMPPLEEATPVIRQLLTLDRTLAKAREVARTKSTEIEKAMAAGKSFDEAAKAAATTFEKSGSFSLLSGPSQLPNATVIRDAALKVPGQTLAGAIDTQDGAIIVYVDSHTLPAPETLAYMTSMFGSRFYAEPVGQAVDHSTTAYLDTKYPLNVIEAWSKTFSSEALAETN